MLHAFLMGLLAVIAVISITVVVVMTVSWLKNFIVNKLKGKDKHKVAFADMHQVVGEYIQEKAEDSDGISMDDLERMCSEAPYVAANVDRNTGEITDYEAVRADELDPRVKRGLKEQNGMIVVDPIED